MKIKEVDKKLVLKDGETGTIDIELPKEEITPKEKSSPAKAEGVQAKAEASAEKEIKTDDKKVLSS